MDWVSGSGSWLFGYSAVQASMLIAMTRVKASAHRLLLSPLASIPATLATSVGLSLLTPVLSRAGFDSGSFMQLTATVGFAASAGYLSGTLLGRASADSKIRMRGSSVSPEREWREFDDPASPEELALAGVRLSVADETKHFKLIGTTGTGKSTAIARMLEPALRRGDRLVIADPDGGYLRQLYDADRGDVILNPFDRRSVKWDPFGEIRQPYDVDQLARSLIPDHPGDDRSWRGYGRTFFSAVARQVHATGVRDVGELFRLLTVAEASELSPLVQGTPAQPFLDPDSAKMFHSLRSVTSSAVASLEYVASQQATSFSIRDWIDKSGAHGKGGALFIPYRAGQIAALRSTISAWMRIAIFAAMDRDEGDQRLWFVVDELDALGPIDGLKDALARIRKFGGRCILGFQSVSQVASTYGSGDAHTLVENCGNTFILRCSASEGGGTSRFASALIGQRQVKRTTISRSSRDTELFGSCTTSDQLSIEPAVMDSEIEQIPDLCGYLKVASRSEWLRVRMPSHESRSLVTPDVPAFVPAEARGVGVRAIEIARPKAPSPAAPLPKVPGRRSRAKSAAAVAPDDVIQIRRPRRRRVSGVITGPTSSAERNGDSPGIEP